MLLEKVASGPMSALKTQEPLGCKDIAPLPKLRSLIGQFPVRLPNRVLARPELGGSTAQPRRPLASLTKGSTAQLGATGGLRASVGGTEQNRRFSW